MGEKIIVGPINKGLKNDRLPFIIDNDSFPTLLNAYQWRGRIKRKRGTRLLGRLQRFFDSFLASYNPTLSTITLGNDGSGNGTGNLLTGFTTLETNASLVPGSLVIVDTTAGNTYTDPAKDGILVGVPAGSGTVNYSTGDIIITGAAGNIITATFMYYPDLPVMGLRDFISNSVQFPATIGFDTKYSYSIQNTFPYGIYDVSFYKNPPTGSYVGYIEKTDPTPVRWNGQNYQQFWTVNYENSMWATNGVTVPFTTTNVGMQYNPIVAVTITAGGPPAIVNLSITGHGLSVGDFLFINEVLTTTGINFQTGYVTAVIGPNDVTVEFPNATIAGNGTGGIAQYLTNTADPTKDCIRWYDGDPTNGSASAPTLTGHKGWVNFCPPISKSANTIADLVAAQYYLAGAKMIIPFKDRLLFLGPVIQTSSVGSQVYLADTIIYSQNGTPYYTSSFTGDASLATTVQSPILTPNINLANQQGASAASYWDDQTGFGGNITAGTSQQIITCSTNEDVLIIGFTRQQTRLIYSGNDIVPFNFFSVNSELGSGSTFSVINTDEGVITLGSRGFIITSQTQARRIDLEIPDEVFQLNLLENGTERVTALRDFINEWIYFTYPVNNITYTFPTQTLQYNYRDNSWAIFRECYTAYGQFRRATGFTWATVGEIFPTWREWNEPWNAGSSTLLQPEVIAGNQQGFVSIRDDGTTEQASIYIQDISGAVVTSPDHCLNVGDYIIINGALGTVGAQVNGKIFSVAAATTNTFNLNPPLPGGLTYIGGGLITRMYVPFIQTKQFPTAWGMARKTRLGPQQYLLSTTSNSQMTLLIFLSQDLDSPYNNLEYPYSAGIVPQYSPNNSLVYSSILYTCPESTNLGLTPANINLNMVTATSQAQIWHRMNTSLIGDTVQIGFTMSDEQMREVNFTNQFAEIELHGFILDVNPSQLLA